VLPALIQRQLNDEEMDHCRQPGTARPDQARTGNPRERVTTGASWKHLATCRNPLVISQTRADFSRALSGDLL
jgi:hypothetical protein